MNRETILQILKEHQDTLKQMGVASLALFGSVARGETTSESDVDILVSFNEPVTFDGYMDVKIFLEDQLKCPVDLVVAEALHARIKPFVQQDAVYVTG